MPLAFYNRSFQTNLDNGVAIPVSETPLKILEFGLQVVNPVNFVELITTVGWSVTDVTFTPPDQPVLRLEVRRDDVIVGSAEQESVSNSEDEPLQMTTTFQTILTNVPTGHRIIRVFASNPQDLQGDITLTGPVNITGKVITN